MKQSQHTYSPFFISVLSCFLLVIGGCDKGKRENGIIGEEIQSEKKLEINSLRDTIPYGPHDIYIPPHDYALDSEIKRIIADIADTTKIERIYQYGDHFKIHILDLKDQTKTGYVAMSRNYQEKKYLKMVNKNPYKAELPSDTTYLGFPVYDVRGMTRSQIERKLDNIIWDNYGEPTHIYTRSVSSFFAPVNMVRGYNFSIIGTEGPMAVQAKMYIENRSGEYIDSIEHMGSEIWHPAVTDDGRFVAYLYGRAFPEEGGGQVTQHFTIYDTQTKEHIYEIENFKTSGAIIASKGNFFMTSTWLNNVDVIRFFDPYRLKIYFFNGQEYVNRRPGKHIESGILKKDDPTTYAIEWLKDCEVIEFENYKNN